MSETAWANREAVEQLGAMMALAYSIQDSTALRPSAIMVPLDMVPGMTVFNDWTVVRGDRVALIYEAP